MNSFLLNSRIAVVHLSREVAHIDNNLIDKAAQSIYQFGNIESYTVSHTDKTASILFRLAADGYKYAEGLLLDRSKKPTYTDYDPHEKVVEPDEYISTEEISKADINTISDDEYYKRLQEVNAIPVDKKRVRNMTTGVPYTLTALGENEKGEMSYFAFGEGNNIEIPVDEFNSNYIVINDDDIDTDKASENVGYPVEGLSTEERNTIYDRAYKEIHDTLEIEFTDDEDNSELLDVYTGKLTQDLKDRKNIVVNTILSEYDITWGDMLKYMKSVSLPTNFSIDPLAPKESPEYAKTPEMSKEPVAAQQDTKLNDKFKTLADKVIPQVAQSREKYKAVGKVLSNKVIEDSLHKILPDASNYDKFISFIKDKDIYSKIFDHKLYDESDTKMFDNFSRALISKLNEYKTAGKQVPNEVINNAITKNLKDKADSFLQYLKATNKYSELFA